MKFSLGSFIPGDSIIHRLDPRTKIAGLVVYLVLLFLVKLLAVFLLPLFFTVGVLLLSKISLRYLVSSLKSVWWLIVFLFVLNLIATPGETVLWSFGFLSVRAEALRQACFMSLRLMLLISGASLLTLTTSPVALTDGLEAILRPLSKVGFPSHEIAMMLTIALRFIPTLIEETDRIRKAQMARGADLESGGLIKRARALLPILIPLFVSAFRRADELAMAMDARCYTGGEGRTRMTELTFSREDAFAFLLMGLLLAAVIVLRVVL